MPWPSHLSGFSKCARTAARRPHAAAGREELTAYYNEIDEYAATWLRNLIAAGHIAPGDVDERDIQDVHPSDLKPYTQCHFFAGIGVWSYALRHAGWPDDRPVWTGSCPCQPFSTAGKGLAFDDERHLWPAWHHLIKECRPPVVLGEQVAGKDADAWVDLVHDDMEALAYAFGAVPFPAAGIGAPHIRDRLYWVAHAAGSGRQRRRTSETGNGADPSRIKSQRLFDTCGLAHARSSRPEEQRRERSQSARSSSPDMASGMANAVPAGRAERRSITRDGPAPRLHSIGGLADTHGGHTGAQRQQRGGQQRQQPKDGRARRGLADTERERIWTRERGSPRRTSTTLPGESNERQRIRPDAGSVDDALPTSAGPTNGLWRDADWLLCRDGKWRPVEPGTFPLAHGAPARVGRLRAYGNAINAEAARAFIEAVMGFGHCPPTLDIHRTSAHGANADDDDSRCPPAQRLTVEI